MSDKHDRDPFDDRYARDDDSDAESSKTSKSAETAENEKSDEKEESGGVRERKNVNMYLPDDLVDDLQLRYSELNVQWRRDHGEDLPKNDEFYPAVIESALRETSIKAELGLDE